VPREPIKYATTDKAVHLHIGTKCPEKWLLIDRETGQVYQGNPNGHWDRLDPVIRQTNKD
jgi:hypothetical protein